MSETTEQPIIRYVSVYSLIAEKDKSLVLQKDGVNAECMNLAPIPVQNDFGGVIPYRIPCNTKCPKCNLVTITTNEAGSPEVLHIEISCQGNMLMLPITEAPKPESKLQMV